MAFIFSKRLSKLFCQMECEFLSKVSDLTFAKLEPLVSGRKGSRGLDG